MLEERVGFGGVGWEGEERECSESVKKQFAMSM